MANDESYKEVVKKYFDVFEIVCKLHSGIKQENITTVEQVQELVKPILEGV